MGSSLPLKFAVLFSISLAGAASFATTTSATSLPFFKPKPKPKATVSDLLSLLGSHQQARSVNSQVARELRSRFKFLVPFSPTQRLRPESSSARRLLNDRNKRDDDELIWWPPAPVMELARLAVDSGGDPGAIHIALDPTIIPVRFPPSFHFFYTAPVLDYVRCINAKVNILGSSVSYICY